MVSAKIFGQLLIKLFFFFFFTINIIDQEILANINACGQQFVTKVNTETTLVNNVWVAKDVLIHLWSMS